jgi:Putative restriction endonuclease
VGEAGILTEGDRVELIHGIVAFKMSKRPAHVWATRRAGSRLESLIGDAFSVRREASARIPLLNELEPDLLIARGDDADYLERHPEPDEIALVVEVSYTTYRYDRDQKYPVFAAAGIPVY